MRFPSPTECQWWLSDGVTYMTLDAVMFTTPAEATTRFASIKQRETNAQYSTSTRPEPGIGEDAFSAFYTNYLNGFGREVLVARKGSFVLTINLVSAGGDSLLRGRAEVTARAAIAGM